MAEDDDAETFGEFAFASFQSNSQSNAPDSLPHEEEDDDDEWGDFVKSPQQSEPSHPSLKGHHPSESPPSWVKPSGALPLSIFGEAEEEEDNSAVAGDFNQGKSSVVAGHFTSTLAVKDVSNSQKFRFDDLYNGFSQIKPEKAPGANATGWVDSVANGVYSISNQDAARSAVVESKNVDLDTIVGISDHSQLTNQSDNDEFSFKSYVPNQSKNIDLFRGWSPELNGFSYNLNTMAPNVQISSSELDTNGQLDASATAVDDDGDDGWEFKDAYSESRAEEVNTNVDVTVREASERSAYSSGSVSGPNESLDLFGTADGDFNSLAKSNASVDYLATSSGILSTSQEVDLFGVQPSTTTLHGFTSETNSNINQNDIRGPSDHSPDVGNTELGEGFGGFPGASAETGHKHGVENGAHEVSQRSAYSSGAVSGLNNSLNLFGTSNGSINFFTMSTESVDHFAASSGTSSSSPEVDLFGIQPSIATLNGFTPNTNSNIKQNNIKGLLDHSPDAGIAELDEDFGEFTAASAEMGSEPLEVPPNDVLSPSKDAVSAPFGEQQGKDRVLNYHKGAIPLSIFGNEEPESDGSSDVQDVCTYQSTSEQRNNHTSTTVISISDLISNLYSQTEQISSISTVQTPSKTRLSLSNAVSSPNRVNDDDHLDHDSWDFKDASQTRYDSEVSLYSVGNTHLSVSSRRKLNNHLDFYSKLKEELCFVTKCQIESLKQARGNAALSGEDAGNSEFQELEQMDVFLEESNSGDDPSRDSYLKEFVDVLLEPQFQVLESEYHLSQKLLLAEKDLTSAMELLRHTTAMLKILNIGTLEEQRMYVSMWSKMISVCTQELKHGASIWNQAAEKHVQTQFLSDPQGRKFVLALGEIYRVVVILGASAKLFKPWVLSCSVDSPTVCALPEECHALWSTSGLEEAFLSVSGPTASNNTSLLSSIKHILGLDALVLQNHVFMGKKSLCRLSMLTAEVAPGMTMVMWGNKEYFVTLANLWANLISHNPPELPQLNLV
ncbi:uncharacterized protein LOC105168888 isoform X2 [Sesamum indicum]|uniref:Uncharacterized protein LOC105168888 isoform X2 n=1 Tax=Sesamum indicum TaxID=4182 RepID=A0A6I9TP39_SESIN|nr:uncharacterized protein LOC105168888 isoform X2 [Sesamum indicum]